MNIVFAYHNGDADLAMESAKAITAMGINMRHRATVCTKNDTSGVSDIIHELKKSFPEVGYLQAQDGFDGWPLGPNQMFADAASYCYQFDEPWMFWEPDCVPMKEGWINELEAEFSKDTGKIMGCLVDGGIAPSGKNVYRLIVGSAVYPSKFLNGCTIAANLYNYNLRYRKANVVPEPWDVRCRWEFLKFGRDTNLIRAYWKSCNYQVKDGAIVFYAESPEAQDIQHVTCPDRIVNPKAVVVHGCKDASLHKMIYEKKPLSSDKKIEQKIAEPVEVLEPQPDDSAKFLANLKELGKTLDKPKKPRKKKTTKCKTS